MSVCTDTGTDTCINTDTDPGTGTGAGSSNLESPTLLSPSSQRGLCAAELLMAANSLPQPQLHVHTEMICARQGGQQGLSQGISCSFRKASVLSGERGILWPVHKGLPVLSQKCISEGTRSHPAHVRLVLLLPLSFSSLRLLSSFCLL